MPIEPTGVWAEVDLVAVAHNVRELRRVTVPGARLMAVVKADGYGHGAAEVARTALANGAEHLGVARLEEAVALRQTGLEAPILVFGYTPPDRTARLLRHTKIVDDMVDKNLGWVPYTQLANLTGRPAISLPLHWTADGLPLGVQFVAPLGGEALLLRLAAQLEQAIPWFDRVAPL